MPAAVRTATAADLRVVIDLARRFSNQIGFIPETQLEEDIAAGSIIITLENDTPAGYMLARPGLATFRECRPIFQTAVYLDAQRRHHGLALLQDIETTTRHAGKHVLQCMCREELESNFFWKAAGFVPIGRRTAVNARKQPLILWRKALTHHGRTLIHALPQEYRPTRPGGRWTTADDPRRQPPIERFTAEEAASLFTRNGPISDP